MKKPLVSVILPNYNHAPYLKERIDSILTQEYQNLELIILDDKSTDNSLDVIQKYKDHPKVSHIIANEENTGNTFVQWERGISLAQGEYVWIAESDDVAKPQLLGTLVEALQSHPKAVVAYCHSQMIDSQSKPMEMTWHPQGSSGETIVYEGNDFIKRKMIVHNHIYNASMVVFKRSVFHMIPTDYQRYRYCGDWLFWTYVSTHGQVIEVCNPLNLYRQHHIKVTVNSQIDGRKWIDIGNILRTISNLLSINNLQRKCLRGRSTKRFLKENKNRFQNIRDEFPDIYGGTTLDIVLYEIGKMFGFLKS